MAACRKMGCRNTPGDEYAHTRYCGKHQADYQQTRHSINLSKAGLLSRDPQIEADRKHWKEGRYSEKAVAWRHQELQNQFGRYEPGEEGHTAYLHRNGSSDCKGFKTKIAEGGLVVSWSEEPDENGSVRKHNQNIAISLQDLQDAFDAEPVEPGELVTVIPSALRDEFTEGTVVMVQEEDTTLTSIHNDIQHQGRMLILYNPTWEGDGPQIAVLDLQEIVEGGTAIEGYRGDRWIDWADRQIADMI